MEFEIKELWLPKAGNNLNEYEDAFFPNSKKNIRKQGLDCNNFAIADGVSESPYSKQWAEILVKQAAKWDFIKSNDNKFLIKARKEWEKWKSNYLTDKNSDHELQWFEENSIQKGGSSTFLKIAFGRVEGKNFGRWQVTAVGDSCLFQVRNNKLIKKFPIQKSRDFNNHPDQVSSNYSENPSEIEMIKKTTGIWRTEDHFYLMTDAISEWFLKESEKGDNPWTQLGNYLNQWTFEKFVQNLRRKGSIKNDDVTIISIKLMEQKRTL